MAPTTPSQSSACKGPCQPPVLSTAGFRCGSCGHATHLACQPGLKPYLKTDGALSKTASEILLSPFVAILCQACTVRADVDRMLAKQPSVLSDVHSAVQDLSEEMKEIKAYQKKVAPSAVETAFKG